MKTNTIILIRIYTVILMNIIIRAVCTSIHMTMNILIPMSIFIFILMITVRVRISTRTFTRESTAVMITITGKMFLNHMSISTRL